jgi:TPP-dependent pyruvate/acetoin dehydrogenase alpha subunit
MVHALQREMLGKMLLIREFEQALGERKDHGFQLLSTGEEAVAVGVCSALRSGDQLLTGGRSIGPALARGADPNRVMAELLGRATGTNKGKGGRGHLADQASGFFGAHAVVGGNISIAGGVALAAQMLNRDNIVVIMFGDGAFGAGALHETLNMSASMKLPLLFVCNNNQLSVSTPRTAALAPKLLSDIGRPFGMPCQTVDGMDLDIVVTAAQEAADYVRSKRGPAFLECVSYRFSSHSTTARETRNSEELRSIRALCPIDKKMREMTAAGLIDADGGNAIRESAKAVVREALEFADSSPFPDPGEALTDVI